MYVFKDSTPTGTFQRKLEYSGALVKPMRNEYCIKPAGTAFTVIDDAGEHIPRKTQRSKNIERCKREDRMFETAKLLVDIAVKAHMQMFGVDRETARYWVSSAMEVVE
jgi:hypothetical protein